MLGGGAEIDYTDPAVIMGLIMAVFCDFAFLGIIGLLIPGIGLAIGAFILLAHYFFGIILLAMFIYRMRGWLGKLLFVLGVILPLPTLTLGLILGIILSNKFIAFLGEQVVVLALSETVIGAAAAEGAAVAELGTEAAVAAAETGAQAATAAAEGGVEAAEGMAQGARAAGGAAETAAETGKGATEAERTAEEAMKAPAERDIMEEAKREELEKPPEPEEKPGEEAEAEETPEEREKREAREKAERIVGAAKRVGTKIDQATGGEGEENEQENQEEEELPKAA